MLCVIELPVESLERHGGTRQLEHGTVHPVPTRLTSTILIYAFHQKGHPMSKTALPSWLKIKVQNVTYNVHIVNGVVTQIYAGRFPQPAGEFSRYFPHLYATILRKVQDHKELSNVSYS